jgi:hypothetical protein
MAQRKFRARDTLLLRLGSVPSEREVVIFCAQPNWKGLLVAATALALALAVASFVTPATAWKEAKARDSGAV